MGDTPPRDRHETAEANGTAVAIFSGATQIGTVTANVSGAWSLANVLSLEGATASPPRRRTLCATPALLPQSSSPRATRSLRLPPRSPALTPDSGASTTDGVTAPAGDRQRNGGTNSIVAIFSGATQIAQRSPTSAGLEPRQRGTRGGANSFTAKATECCRHTGVASAICVAHARHVAPTDITLSGNTSAENWRTGRGRDGAGNDPGAGGASTYATDRQCRRTVFHQCDRPAESRANGRVLDYESAPRTRSRPRHRPGRADLRQGVHPQCDQRQRGAHNATLSGARGENSATAR